jgi:hypothetical protein
MSGVKGWTASSGAAFSVLAQARIRLCQIRAKGEDPLAVQLELTPGRGR